MAPSARFVVHLRLGGVLVAAERAAAPSLHARPIAVGARPDSAGLVVAVSREAADAGVEAGMPAAIAGAVAPGCVFLEGHLDRHLDFAAEIDALVRHHADAVRWSGFDQALIEVPVASRLRGMVESLRADLIALGLDVACGIASSPFAALVASWLVAPNGVLQVRPGYERAFLAPVSIDALEGLAPEVAARARARGWTRLGDIASLDAGTAVDAFGGRGLVWQQWCAGADAGSLAMVLPAGTPRPVRFVERLAPTPLAPWPAAPDSLARVVEGALRGLFDRAAAAGCVATLALLRVERGDGRAATRRVSLSCRVDARTATTAAVALAEGLAIEDSSQVVVAVAGLQPRTVPAARGRSRRVPLLGKLGARASWPRPSSSSPARVPPAHVRSA